MTKNTDRLLESALRLAPEERFALAEGILHSLDQPDPETDRVWLEEAARRLEALKRGEIAGVPAEDVLGAL